MIQTLLAVAGGVQLSAQDLPGLRGWVGSLDSLRPWIASARAAIVDAPGEGDDRLTRLVALQTRMGDLTGARATARVLGQSYRPFLAIAKQQLSTGTVGGAIETCNLAPSVEARSTALRHLGEYLANGEDWRPVAHAIVIGSERAAVYQAAARQLRSRGERQHAREALAEAGRLVTGDTTVRGREVTGAIAGELAAVGNIAGALTLLAHAPTREVRIAWLGQVAAGVRSPWIDRPYETSDSLFHMAFAAADSLPGPERLIWRDSLARAQGPSRFDPSIQEEFDVQTGTGSEVMTAVASLAAKGQSRRAVEAIVKRLGYRRTRRSATAEVEGFATIALRHAAAISPAYADTVRAASASPLAAAASALALPMVRAIRDPGLRSSAAAAAASETPSGENVLAFADAADSTWARDVIYSVATTRLVGQRRFNSVVGIARRIKSPTLRGLALVAIAAAVVDARPEKARALRAEALPLLDPSEQTGRLAAVPDLAPSLRHFVAIGEHRRLQAWAESQPTPQRRALAFLLVLEGATVGGE